MRQSGSLRRLDVILVERFPHLTRSRARAEIMSGRVMVDGKTCDKPGTPVPPGAAVTMLEPEHSYASRGGLKLEGALRDLAISVDGLVVLDAGASTGGFTDCLLQHGARRVYAVDVGYGQLDWRLRHHPGVVVMERFNIRNLQPQQLPETPDLAVVDISFISLRLVIPVLRDAGLHSIIALVKPQFEAGRAEAGKGRGVIVDPAVHRDVLNGLISFACDEGFCCLAVTFSQLRGPKGNIEFFVHWTQGTGRCRCMPPEEITGVVERAHAAAAPSTQQHR